MIFFLRRDLMDELVVYIREAVDRKQENVRRRRRRDALRLQLVKVLENMAANCTFGIRWVLQFFWRVCLLIRVKHHCFFIVFKIISFFLLQFFHSSCVIERETMSLHPTFVEYIEGARLYLETETDKENTSIREVKKHFCDFIRIMIKSFSRKYTHTTLSLCFVFIVCLYVFPVQKRLKNNSFFYAFGFVWSEKFNKTPYMLSIYAWRSFVRDRRLWLIKVNCLCRAFVCWNVFCV